MNKFSIYIILLLGIFSCYSELGAENQTTLLKDQKESLSHIQIPFIKNEGQVKSEEVKFYAQTFNGTVFITDKGELIYTMVNPKDYLGAEDCLLPDGSFSGGYAFSLKEIPLTDKTPQINALENSPTAVNYFIGDNPKDWRSNIQSYNLITLGEVWKGITFNLKANSRNIEKLFVINPDGNPESIKFSLEGVEELSLNQAGELELKTDKKSIGFTSPIAYQEINGERKPVNVSFRLIDKTKYGFAVGDYDKSIPLVIDPLLSSTFIGGFGTEYARGIIIDPVNGNVFIAGYSGLAGSVNNFPTQGQTPLTPYDATWNWNNDVVVCKFNPTLTTLIASTYLGSANADGAYGIAMDTQGNIFVCGFAGLGFPILTDRPPITLPSGTLFTPTAFDTSFNGGAGDAFIAKLSNSLNALLASTYVGGTGSNDAATGIVMEESTNNVFICGYTDSDAFPSTGGPVYSSNSGASSANLNGGVDAFVAKLNGNLSGPTGRQENFYYAGVFIGSAPVGPPWNWPGTDIATAIAIDSTKDPNTIYITGYTTNGNPYFPTTNNAYDTEVGVVQGLPGALEGGQEGFVCKFSSDLRTIIASTYLGFNSADSGWGLAMGPAIDDEATVYITGVTSSSDWEVTTGAYNEGLNSGRGSQDVFITRMDSLLTRLVNSTWIGGVDTETVNAICIGSNNNVYICGTAESSDYPATPDAFSITNTGGAGDVFVSYFNETLSTLNASTMIGGQFLDVAYCIKPDSTGNIIFAGVAGDNAYPTWPTTGTDIAYDTSYNGTGDIFVTRITADLTGGLSQQQQPSPPGEEIVDPGEGIIAGSSALAYLDANAFKQGCFIATAVYGNPMHPNVVTLRNFRDKYLLTNKLGSIFVNWYYRLSPPVAQYLKHTPLQASAVRCALTPIVYTIKYPLLIPLIGGLLLALGYYWLRRRYAKQYPIV